MDGFVLLLLESAHKSKSLLAMIMHMQISRNGKYHQRPTQDVQLGISSLISSDYNNYSDNSLSIDRVVIYLLLMQNHNYTINFLLPSTLRECGGEKTHTKMIITTLSMNRDRNRAEFLWAFFIYMYSIW